MIVFVQCILEMILCNVICGHYLISLYNYVGTIIKKVQNYNLFYLNILITYLLIMLGL